MRKQPLSNYGVVLAIALFFYIFALLLEPLLKPEVIVGSFITTKLSLWIEAVFNWYLISITVCLVLSLAWLYMSEHTLRIDWKGTHSQRSWWLIFLFFATLAAPAIGYGLVWPPVLRGGPFAFGLLILCALIQFWSGTLFASPNPMSVVGGSMFRKTGL